MESTYSHIEPANEPFFDFLLKGGLNMTTKRREALRRRELTAETQAETAPDSPDIEEIKTESLETTIEMPRVPSCSGVQFEDFTFIRQLGKGAFGTVFLA